MPITEAELSAALQASFPEAEVKITDLAGDNDHWKAEIICPSFKGQTRVQQHRRVQEAVSAHDIHALAITTRAQ